MYTGYSIIIQDIGLPMQGGEVMISSLKPQRLVAQFTDHLPIGVIVGLAVNIRHVLPNLIT